MVKSVLKYQIESSVMAKKIMLKSTIRTCNRGRKNGKLIQ